MRSICSQRNESEQEAVVPQGHVLATSTKGQQMTAANCKTNEVNKPNLDLSVDVLPPQVCRSILC